MQKIFLNLFLNIFNFFWLESIPQCNLKSLLLEIALVCDQI